MPGCNVTRRDVLRWSAVALASPIVLHGDFLSRVAAASGRTDDVSPVNLELVTLTEDRAVITWYTGYTGTDDGLGRMQPAPARRRGALGHATRSGSNRVAGGRSARHAVPLRRADRPRARTDLLLPGALEREAGAADAVHADQRQRGRHLGLRARRPAARTASRRPSRRRAGSSSPSRCATTCTWARRRPGSSAASRRSRASSRFPACPPYPEVMLESLVDDASALGADFLLAAGDITAEAVPGRPEQGRAAAQPVRQVPPRLLRHPRQPRPRPRRRRVRRVPGRPVAGQRLLPRPVLPGRRADVLHRASSRACGSSGIDTYDKPGRGSDARRARRPSSSRWFRAELAKDRDQPTIVFGHHPLVVEELAVPDHAEQHARRRRRPRRSCDDYSRTPGLFLHHAGHTHRNKRTISPVAPGVTHQEIAAGKEYPGGFSLLRLHTGGLRAELLQDAAATSPGSGANEAGRRSRAPGRSSRSAAASATATPWSSATSPTCDVQISSRSRHCAVYPPSRTSMVPVT